MSIVLPIIFLIICVFLVTFPCYVSPWEVGVGVIVIISGIPVYWIFIYWKNKPKCLVRGSGKLIHGTEWYVTQKHAQFRNILVEITMSDNYFFPNFYSFMGIKTLLTDLFIFSEKLNMICAKIFMCVQAEKNDWSTSSLVKSVYLFLKK